MHDFVKCLFEDSLGGIFSLVTYKWRNSFGVN